MVDGRSSGVSPGRTSTSWSSASGPSSSGRPVRPDADGVAGAPLHVLLDEVEVQVGLLGLQLLGDPLGAVAHHDHDPVDRAVGQRVEDVAQHRPAAQQVQRLGPRRPHPGALAGGEHDGGEAAFGHVTGLADPAPGGNPSSRHMW